MSNPSHYDLAIIGAGPAGTAACIALKDHPIRIALIDKATFPRDKICGDALSPDVVNQLGILGVEDAFHSFQEKLPCKAVRFSAPNSAISDLDLNAESKLGYVSKRMDFDQFMFNEARKNESVELFLGTSVKHVSGTGGNMSVVLDDGKQIEANLVLGADGAHSVVKRTFQPSQIDRKHHSAAVRLYYSGVTGFSEDNAIELHYLKGILPGYLWVFPLQNGEANVGIGVLSSEIQKQKLDLKSMLQQIVQTHPVIAPRFKDAQVIEGAKGFGLPLGSKKRQISGEGYLLLGDAASLINPLSGEGIGNAIRSGRIAADHLIAALKANRFDNVFNRAYDAEVYRRMWRELKINHLVLLAFRYPWLCNLIIDKAIRIPMIKRIALSGFSASGLKKATISAT